MRNQSSGAASRIPSGVWVLGFVSMLMDISSEMIHSLLPLFLVGALGVSVTAVGLIEGIAESTALISKIFSGVLSDRIGRRKGLAVLGYGMGALTKPLFALASGVGLVVAARFIDRVGKGIRGAPRDALVADITPPAIRGAAFGLRQSLDTLGALLGPLIATALMLLWENDFRTVFWVAVVPGLLAVVLLLVGIQEPERAVPARSNQPILREALARLTGAYWWVVAVGAVFTLARFSEAFLVLRASQLGVPTAFVPLVMVGMNMVYAGSAYPFGKLSDTLNHRTLLLLGMAFLIGADLVFALASDWLLLGLGMLLWGLHMGMTQGLLAAMVADTAPPDLRGTAFGVFNLIGGIAMLASSAIAGLMWDAFGPAVTFYVGAGLATSSVIGLAMSPQPELQRERTGHQRPHR